MFNISPLNFFYSLFGFMMTYGRALAGALLVALLALAMSGCNSGDGGTKPGTPARPGQLKLVSQSSPAAYAARSTRAVAGVDFDLGNFDATGSHLFMLRNTGSTRVNNIQLTSSDPRVVVTPNTIGFLDPEGTDGMSPIIQVTVVHGTNASGLGSAALLPPGEFTFEIDAVGVEVGTGDETTAHASMGGIARVADFHINDITDTALNGRVDLVNVSLTTLRYEDGARQGIQVDAFSYDTVYPDYFLGLELVNDGNVDITYVSDPTYDQYGIQTHARIVIVVPVGESRVLTLPRSDYSSLSAAPYRVPSSVRSGGVVINPSACTLIVGDRAMIIFNAYSRPTVGG